MASAAKQQMNVWEQKYYDITELYALADELLATVPTAADPAAQLALIESLVETIGESTDALTEEYIALCEGVAQQKQQSKSKVESALRRIYGAAHACTTRIRDSKNAALLVIKKLKRQLEMVVANFIDFLTLSLDRIMQKHDVEEIRARHANIAAMLAQHGQGA